MKRHAIAVLLAAAALSPLVADVMDRKAAVIRTVETAFAGTAELTCDDTKGWSFDISASVDDGRAGEAVVEMVGTVHHGENRGDKTVVLDMFYISQKGMPLAVQHPEVAK